jgi:hypothetical protein
MMHNSYQSEYAGPCAHAAMQPGLSSSLSGDVHVRAVGESDVGARQHNVRALSPLLATHEYVCM